MTKKDILELKRRFKKSECTFTRLSGCYVDSEKNIITNIAETFLNLEEDEFFKYLEIANKTLSGTLGNNLLELNFPLEEEMSGGKQKSLLALRESKLKNEEMLSSFYQSIIETYSYTGNYLILVYHDAYDVITKTSDNMKLDESEEVYEYILCAICPVTLSKPGLGYREDEHRIGARIRDWVVEAPETGFLFPAFSDRSTDIHSLLYFTKNAKDPRPEFMEAGLGCPSKRTATEQKITFQSIVERAINVDEEEGKYLVMDIQEALNDLVDIPEDSPESKAAPVILTTNTIQELLAEKGLPEEVTMKIEKSYQEQFEDAPPAVEHLLDAKILSANEQRRKEQGLIQQVEHLKQMLEETKQGMDEETDSKDIIVKVNPEKVMQITSQVINGKKCIIIPIEENEHANINGEMM